MCFASMPRPSPRGFQVGPAGLGRPTGLGVPPRGHRLSDNGSDLLLESVGSWFCFTVASAMPAGLGEAGWPPSGPSRPLTWTRPCSAFEHPLGKWVPAIFVILGCLVDLWMGVEAFRCFQLNQGLTLDLEPLDCVTLSLVRSRGCVFGGAMPVGVEEAGRPGILPNSAQFLYTYS